MNAKQWSIFITLACLWGSSFLWIKIAVQESSPLTVVTLRLLMGLSAAFVFFVLGKRKWFAVGRCVLNCLSRD
jgi:drug/metabolite transporter (DMT)-like permease